MPPGLTEAHKSHITLLDPKSIKPTWHLPCLKGPVPISLQGARGEEWILRHTLTEPLSPLQVQLLMADSFPES